MQAGTKKYYILKANEFHQLANKEFLQANGNEAKIRQSAEKG